jgi:hypothetical protein
MEENLKKNWSGKGNGIIIAEFVNVKEVNKHYNFEKMS